MKANLLIKENIDALLAAHGKTRQALAMWVLRTTDKNRANSWISHIFGKKDRETREIQIEYLDRIGDFFGLAPYQLFQPGIAEQTERRSGKDRRVQPERRINAAVPGLPATPMRGVSVTLDDELMLEDLHALTYAQYQRVKGWIAVARYGPRSSGRGTAPPPEPPASTAPRYPRPAGRRGQPTSTPKTPTPPKK